jgi:hypothetical protein
MKQVILELNEETAAELERVAPGHARQRSAFLRAAIRRALDAAAEERMAAAYRSQPDGSEPAYLDPEAWQPMKPPARRKAKKA